MATKAPKKVVKRKVEKKAPKKVKSKGGRPTKYKKKYCRELIEHMEEGFSYTTFAAKIEVNLDSLYEWEKVNPEFSEAKKKAFRKCQMFWEEMGINGALGKLFGFNASSWIFNMKNRFKWTDRQEVKVDTPTPIVIRTSKGDLSLGVEEGSNDD